ncbi:MAG: ATP synthase subunit I [Limnohabitans sp.]
MSKIVAAVDQERLQGDAAHGQPAPFAEADGDDLATFKPLSAQEAQQWRRRQPALSPWRVVLGQTLVGLAVVVVGWPFGGWLWAVSAAWGAAAVIVPAMWFARILARQLKLAQPGSALALLMGWELVKVALTVLLLVLAPLVLKPLSWPGLLLGFVLTLKVYGVALLWGRQSRKADPQGRRGV